MHTGESWEISSRWTIWEMCGLIWIMLLVLRPRMVRLRETWAKQMSSTFSSTCLVQDLQLSPLVLPPVTRTPPPPPPSQLLPPHTSLVTNNRGSHCSYIHTKTPTMNFTAPPPPLIQQSGMCPLVPSQFQEVRWRDSWRHWIEGRLQALMVSAPEFWRPVLTSSVKFYKTWYHTHPPSMTTDQLPLHL